MEAGTKRLLDSLDAVHGPVLTGQVRDGKDLSGMIMMMLLMMVIIITMATTAGHRFHPRCRSWPWHSSRLRMSVVAWGPLRIVSKKPRIGSQPLRVMRLQRRRANAGYLHQGSGWASFGASHSAPRQYRALAIAHVRAVIDQPTPVFRFHLKKFPAIESTSVPVSEILRVCLRFLHFRKVCKNCEYFCA